MYSLVARAIEHHGITFIISHRCPRSPAPPDCQAIRPIRRTRTLARPHALNDETPE